MTERGRKFGQDRIHFSQTVSGEDPFIFPALHSVQNSERTLMIAVLFHNRGDEHVRIEKYSHLSVERGGSRFSISIRRCPRTSSRVAATPSNSRTRSAPLEKTSARFLFRKPATSLFGLKVTS